MGRRKGGIGKRSRIRFGTELDALGAIGEVMGSEGAVPETPPPLDSLSSALAWRWRGGAGRAGGGGGGGAVACTLGLYDGGGGREPGPRRADQRTCRVAGARHRQAGGAEDAQHSHGGQGPDRGGGDPVDGGGDDAAEHGWHSEGPR